MEELSYFCLVVQFRFGLSSPIFIWSNDKSIEFPPVITGHHTSLNEFSDNYLRNHSNHIVVFVQDELSMTDILVHGGVYGSNEKTGYEQLKSNIILRIIDAYANVVVGHGVSAMVEFTATYLPNVENPLDSLLKLSNGDNGLKLVSVDARDVISSLHQVDFTQKSLFFVDLSLSEKNKAEYDMIIGEVVSYMKYKLLFAAFFTGRRYESTVRRHSKSMRKLKIHSVHDVNSAFNGAFMVKLGEIRVISTGELIFDHVPDVVKNSCENHDISSDDNCSVAFAIPLNEYGDLTLTYMIKTFTKNDVTYWYSPEVRVTFQIHSMDFDVRVVGKLAPPTPIGFSFSCSATGMIEVHKSDFRFSEYTPRIEFAQYQIQLFRNISLKGFARNIDCDKMITIPILTGLICAGVCLAILGFGIVFLLQIHPPDRFDNPKRKFFLYEIEN